MAPKLLYFSASIGLGHVVRDIAIAKELRKRIPGVEIDWIAANPASIVLKEAGERLHPDAAHLGNDSGAAERAASGKHRLELFRYCVSALGPWFKNIRAVRDLVRREQYDLLVADEAYELDLGLRWNLLRLGSPFAMIYDFVGYFPTSRHPLDLALARFWNWEWSRLGRFYDGVSNVALFVGEPEDVPDRSLGYRLPNCRDLARGVCDFLGYVVRFDPEEYVDRTNVRAALGYGSEPLVVCSIGGSAVGKDLLELCGRTYPLVRARIPDLRMVLVCGPRLDTAEVQVPPGVEVREYVPKLHEHFAACDLAIVQGGGSTTLELTALRRPFLYFPLEGHFEQEVHVAGRLRRSGAGTEVAFSATDPEALADLVLEKLESPHCPASIRVDGARRAADALARLLTISGPVARDRPLQRSAVAVSDARAASGASRRIGLNTIREIEK